MYVLIRYGNAWTPARFWPIKVVIKDSVEHLELLEAGWYVPKAQPEQSELKKEYERSKKWYSK